MLDVPALTTFLSLLPTLGAPLGEPGSVPWLTLVTFAPLLGVFALMLMPREQDQALRTTALIFAIGAFIVSLGPMVLFDPQVPLAAGAPFTFQLMEGRSTGSRSLGSTTPWGSTASACG